MPDNKPAAAVADLTRQFGLELAFVEAGKDTGLLPLNSFLMQLEEMLPVCAAPAMLVAAVAVARGWLDQVFDTTVLLDSPSIAKLGEWHGWMETAVEHWLNQKPLPEIPPAWGLSAAASGRQNSPLVVAGQNKLPGEITRLAAEFAPPADPSTIEPTLVLSLGDDSDLLREFCNESQEHLSNIELGVLTLEDKPTDMSTLNSIFRAFHTFKGGSGFLNLKPINSLAHELESLLDLARQHKLTITSEVIDIILGGGDTLKQFIKAIVRQLDGHEPGATIIVPTLALHARVRAVLSGRSAAAFVTPAPRPARVETPAVTTAIAPSTSAAVANPVAWLAPKALPPQLATATSGNLVPTVTATSVKVDTSKLDGLVDLVGELVIAQSQVSQDPAVQSVASRLLVRNLAQVGRITKELQRTAMSLRMVPIRQTFQKMTRLVRDSSARLGKKIVLTMSGEDTELDRTVVEEISDPLIHMVRNSVDHGIEKPEVRLQAGKPPTGTVHLAACHQGGNIVIEIKDDGAGLNTKKIIAKAITQGIVPPDAALSENEIFSLIFAPGFSTAEIVTDISGRGVGMDVVRRNIDKMRGKIEIASTLGQGSTFTISLPLTMAIIDGLIVGVGGERFILPTLSVRESFRPKAAMISSVRERGEMVNVRGHLSPLLRLHEYFNIPAQATDPLQGVVVVIEANGADRCLLVDQLIGKQEVVIKTLGETFKHNRALAGAAILGDGRVGLILEVNSLVRLPREPLARAVCQVPGE